MTQKLQIREGGYYRNRAGNVCGPMKRMWQDEYPWDDGTETFMDDGKLLCDSDNELDIVSEVYVSDAPIDHNIIAAAPDLLEALKNVMDFIFSNEEDDGSIDEGVSVLIAAKAAISKAEGRS